MKAPRQNHPLKDYNTFGLNVTANQFYQVDTIEELSEAIKNIKSEKMQHLILGGGSNILFTSNYNGAIIHPSIDGVETIDDNEKYILLRVGAGVEWDSLVEQTVSMGLCGLENLSLIPGKVGAAPIQNIGAYGVEAKDSIEKVDGIFIDTLEHFSLNNAECKFGYRNSVFKNKLKGKVVVTHVTFRLSKECNLVTHYGNLEVEIDKLGSKTLQNVRQAVINIRNAKLPDPKEFGNAGSFFKNPVVDIALVEALQEKYTHVPFYPVNDNLVKLPAGWLIEKSGWKGKRVGNVGVHKDQALVIVNFGNATGQEIVELAHQVRQSIMEMFNVSLEMEVNVV
jgi:UDP-N-acetylmuramate dehydrogenase